MERHAVSFEKEFRIIFWQCIKCEWAQKDRFIAPLLFAVTSLLLCNIVFIDLAESMSFSLFIAEVFFVILLSSQVCLLKQFAIEQRDQVDKIIRVSEVRCSSWYLAKYAVMFLLIFFIVVFTILLASLFQTTDASSIIFHGFFWFIICLCVSCLSSLGSLLSAVVVNSGNKEILLPILFYPLSCPVLIGGIEGANLLFLMQESSLNSNITNWIYLLLGFNVIYLTLGLTLFDELSSS